MIKLVRSSILALALTATAAGAFPSNVTRYVDSKTGYVVETRDLAGTLRISGHHPDTGRTFKVKVSPAGRVVGTWEGKPVNYVMGETPSNVQMAQAASAGAAGK